MLAKIRPIMGLKLAIGKTQGEAIEAKIRPIMGLKWKRIWLF